MERKRSLHKLLRHLKQENMICCKAAACLIVSCANEFKRHYTFLTVTSVMQCQLRGTDVQSPAEINTTSDSHLALSPYIQITPAKFTCLFILAKLVSPPFLQQISSLAFEPYFLLSRMLLFSPKGLSPCIFALPL